MGKEAIAYPNDNSYDLDPELVHLQILDSELITGLTQANWETRFLVDIYVLKTMIYGLKGVSLGKSWIIIVILIKIDTKIE